MLVFPWESICVFSPLCASPICFPYKEAIDPSREVLRDPSSNSNATLVLYPTIALRAGKSQGLSRDLPSSWKLVALRAECPCLLSRKAGRVPAQCPHRPQNTREGYFTAQYFSLGTALNNNKKVSGESSRHANCEMRWVFLCPWEQQFHCLVPCDLNPALHAFGSHY